MTVTPSSTTSSRSIRLNCDMGESLGPWRMGCDEDVMPLVDMANIACGFHASDPVTMDRTLRLAAQHSVVIGAHPAYPDLTGFGRRSMRCSREEIVAMIRYQVGALSGLAEAQSLSVNYVKPHGALYNDMMRDPDILRAVLDAVAGCKPSLALMVLATPDQEPIRRLAEAVNVPLLFEAFADRAYDERGFLVSRQEPNAVYQDPQRILEQALRLAEDGVVVTRSGDPLRLSPDTLCVHGDNAESVNAVRAIREALGSRQSVAPPPA